MQRLDDLGARNAAVSTNALRQRLTVTHKPARLTIGHTIQVKSQTPPLLRGQLAYRREHDVERVLLCRRSRVHQTHLALRPA